MVLDVHADLLMDQLTAAMQPLFRSKHGTMIFCVHDTTVQTENYPLCRSKGSVFCQ